MIKEYRKILLCLSVLVIFGTGCARIEEPDFREKEYGYVQFKLYKAASYDKTKANGVDDYLLEYLSDATKIMVQLANEPQDILQTLVLSAYDHNSAEFGLRSAKLKLLAGTYKIKSYTLYDALDNVLTEPALVPAASQKEFTVVPGGLCSHDLLADVRERGFVRFHLVKDTSDFKQTKAPMIQREYTFDEILSMDIHLRKDNTRYEFNCLPVKFSTHFLDNGSDVDGYYTSSSICDTLLSIPAGVYTIDSYSLYDNKKGTSLLEYNDNVKSTIEVRDNQTTEGDVPVRLYQDDEYIKDYYALKAIWLALDGPNWYYSGEDYPQGCNWDFNKDVDLWGDQPGVSLHSNGRVALISVSDFGFGGRLPAEIGQLSELTELYLGTHNDMNQNEFDDPTLQSGTRDRMARHKQYLAYKYPAIQMSEPVARGLMEHDKHIPEISMYSSMTEAEVMDAETDLINRPQLKDAVPGKLYNALTEIDPSIWKLDKLERLTVANGLLEVFPVKPDYIDDDHGLAALTDLEIYNCRELQDPTAALQAMPSLISINISQNNPSWTSEQANSILHSLADPVKSKSVKKIQILYMNNSNLTKVDGEVLRNMKSLGLLDLSDNKISQITPFGKEINLVQLHLNNNQITELKRGDDGYFCGISDVETFSVRNNKLTEFPDIFDAESIWGMSSVDFSYNNITRFAGYERDVNGKEIKVGENKGIYVETLTLANNPIETYPMMFRDTDSKIAYINMRGCGMKEIPDSAFTYKNAVYLTSFDLSYNRLRKFPMNFHAGNIPYLYGLDISYNQFSDFPYEPFDMRGLTVFAIRGQRNEQGQRCLTQWPTGVYQHAGLRGLYLGSNDIRVVDDTISSLCYYLDISDNPNIYFDASDICWYWQQGAYFLFYDKTQDIVGCDDMLH